jgi:DNA polymerase III epsilon subunit family exonuclease
MDWLRPLWRRPQWRTPPLDTLIIPGFVAIDLETTGLNSRTDVVVAIAAIPVVAGEPRTGVVMLVNPGRPIPAASSAVHGITDAMVETAPRIEEALQRIDRMCDSYPIVGHGVAFDMAILARERRSRGQRPPASPVVCTMRLAAALYPGWTDVGLDAVAARLGITVRARHTAEGDALAAAEILIALLPAARERGARTLADLQWLERTAAI